MNLKTLFTITAIIAILIGLALILVPEPMMSSYGAEVNDTSILMARLLGAADVSIAVIAWLVRDSPGSSDLRAIILAFFLGDLLGFVISLVAILQGLGNALGWSTVAIYLLLAIGFGYYYWKK